MGSSILKMNRFGLLCLFIGLLAITCANADQKPGGGGKCKDKYDEKKCIKMMEAGKCEDKKVAKKCMKTCEKCEDNDGGEAGKCKDKMDKKKCTKLMEAGKCEDEKVAKKCMKTCDMCEDEGPKKTPFELIDENGDGNITRDEWQMKIEKAMDKVMHITNVTLSEDYEDLYDDIWEAMDSIMLPPLTWKTGKCFLMEKTNVVMNLIAGFILPSIPLFPSFKLFVNIKLSNCEA